MYCPRCERTIKTDDLTKLNEELKNKFGQDSLEKGECPVCSTQLIDLSKRRSH